MPAKTIPFEQVLEEMLKSPEARKLYDELEPISQVIGLRIRRGLTQKQLAELVGTTQSSIARLESFSYMPRLSFLQRVVDALGGRMTITITACEDLPGAAADQPSSGPEPAMAVGPDPALTTAAG